MNITHSTQGDPQKDTTITFSVLIYPPRDPSYQFNSTDSKGNKCDYYLIVDRKRWFSKNYTRTIKYGWTTITKKQQKADQYFAEVVQYINNKYPMP